VSQINRKNLERETKWVRAYIILHLVFIVQNSIEEGARGEKGD
jgi:hypothetical protein